MKTKTIKDWQLYLRYFFNSKKPGALTYTEWLMKGKRK